MKATREKAAVAGVEFLSNPVVQWTLAIGVPIALVYFFLPSVYNGVKNGAKTFFSDLTSGFSSTVDNTQSEISSIIGRPDSTAPNRPADDFFQGLFVGGDRAWSDLVDWFK